ncbi:MAG TPA: hypothetical protein VGT02_02465 [Methylomirabilota bacterium]|jgi:hypothetical protein|nr:hypothetical protein [Methylomirabilota bacterium]
MGRVHAALASAALALALDAGSASAAECTVAEQHTIADELPRLTTWSAIYAHVKTYTPRCDDGWMAEGYSDTVVKMLAKRWARVEDLARLARRDRAFRAFVLRHVDATTDLGDLRRVAANAGRRCPPGLEELCGAVAKAAKDALKETAD